MSGGSSVTQSVSGNPDITNYLIKQLEVEKRKAVAKEDYVKIAELKHQSSSCGRLHPGSRVEGGN